LLRTDKSPNFIDLKTTAGKLAMWLFLASDCLFFGAFIAGFLKLHPEYADLETEDESAPPPAA